MVNNEGTAQVVRVPQLREFSAPDESPVHLELFIGWLYRRRLSPIPQKLSDDETSAQVSHLLGLFLRAAEWDIPDLQNCVMDTILDSGESFWLTAEDVPNFYNSTSPGSPLRAFIVDNFLFSCVFMSTGDDDDSRKAALKEHIARGNAEFVADCYDKVFQYIYDGDPEDPRTYLRCTYHVHPDGKKCPVERKEPPKKRRR